MDFQSQAIPFLRPASSGPRSIAWPEGIQWFRAAFFIAVVIVTAICLLYLQYKTRRTRTSRVLACGLLLVGILGYLLASPSLVMELHTWLRRPAPFPGNVRVDLGAGPRKFAVSRRGQIQLSIPLNVTGLPADIEAKLDALSLKFELADGRKWQTLTTPSRDGEAADLSFDAIVFIDPSFFAAGRSQGVTIRGSLYITAFKRARATTVTLTHKPMNVGDGLQCYVNDVSGQLHCRSAFRWPAMLVYARVRNGQQSLWPLISYSPFPAGMDLNYIEEHRASGPSPQAPQATIILMKPVSHFRSDFTVEQFKMEDFARPQ